MKQTKRIFALGFFDGVHLGHQALLAECARLAQAQAVETAAITFDRHPQALFTAEPPALINTAEDRIRLLQQYGIRHVFQYPVSKEVMSTFWRDFLDALVDCGAAGFVCGADFRFGARGQGNAEKLKRFCQEQGFPWAVVPDQLRDGARISSTRIRRLLEQGQVETANAYLGHPHIFTGTVVHGRQLGRTIGIPTANLELPDGILIPRFGVYACRVYVDHDISMAVTNVGMRPTVSGHHITVEPWILDFDGDLYGKTITLEFYAFLRPEKKFESLEALKAAIEENARQTREYFRT